MVDVDVVHAPQYLGEHDSLNVLLSLAVSHDDRDEVLSHVAAVLTPGLSETEEERRGGRLALQDSIVLQSRPEMLVVVKHLRGLVLVDLHSLMPRRRGVGAIHDGPAQRSHVHLSVYHLQDDSVPHSAEDVLGHGLGMAVGQFNSVLIGATGPLVPGAVRRVGEDTAGAFRAINVVGTSQDGPVVDPDFKLPRGDLRGDRGTGGRVLKVVQQALHIVLVCVANDARRAGAAAGRGRGIAGQDRAGHSCK